MNQQERVQLDKMIAHGNVKDVTSDIRQKKHSPMLRQDLSNIKSILADQAAENVSSKLTQSELSGVCEQYAPFMFRNYTDLFNRAKNGDLDFDIMDMFVDVLERIEEGTLDQHQGAHEIGSLLKRLYIDSALKRSDRLDDDSSLEEKESEEPLDVNYKHYKKRQKQIAEGKVRKCAVCKAETPVCELVRRCKGNPKYQKKKSKVCKSCA